MNQSIEAISKNLRNIREKRNLSLDQLSELTGVSKSMLRQIETGKSSPTISTIWKIANGLRISFTSLLKKTEVAVEVKPFRGEKPIIPGYENSSLSPMTAGSEHARLFPLIPFDSQQAFETYYFELDPGIVCAGNPHGENVYEYVFVMSGHLKITVEGKDFEIKEKEFMQFHGSCSHEYLCIGDKMASIIMLLSYFS